MSQAARLKPQPSPADGILQAATVRVEPGLVSRDIEAQLARNARYYTEEGLVAEAIHLYTGDPFVRLISKTEKA